MIAINAWVCVTDPHTQTQLMGVVLNIRASRILVATPFNIAWFDEYKTWSGPPVSTFVIRPTPQTVKRTDLPMATTVDDGKRWRYVGNEQQREQPLLKHWFIR